MKVKSDDYWVLLAPLPPLAHGVYTMPVEFNVIADESLPMLLTIITMVWTVFGCWVGYQTAMLRHKNVMKEIEKRDQLLDHSTSSALAMKDEALQSKDETIKVLRGMLYAIADENKATG